MKLFMRILSGVALLLFVSYLGGYVAHHNMGIFNPQGTISLAEKNLIVTALGLMLLVVIPVYILLFTFALRYKAGTKHARYTPDWNTNKVLETIWWLIPTGIVFALSIITWTSTHDLDPFKPLDSTVKPITIEVIALDWKWLFIYPEERIATVNYIVLPKNTPINFKITSDAPMNAFWIPQLGGQVYAMSGMTAKLHLLATQEGDYQGLSSNFSGDGFAGMKFIAHVSSGEEYVEWINKVRTSPEILSIDTYKELMKQSKNNPVTYYASVKDDMYTSIIMRYMSGSNTKKSTMLETMPTMDHMETH